ncbi:MAG: hypothetical protein JNM17_03110 [Archangium sp.]|nr:hypothetical protein [Archangium sp.]
MGLLLILLVGDLTAPLKPHLEAAVPAAFAAPRPEVAVGSEAPAGRTVAWVTATGPDDVVLTLHTARIPGDLRRELHFSASDKPATRAKSIAFALAVLAKEREDALAPLPPEQPPPPGVVERVWEIEARGVGSLSIGEGALGGGGQILAHRLFPFGLSAGVGFELNGSGAKNTSLTQGSGWVEVNLRFGGPLIVPRLTLGAGAMINVLSREKETTTVWLPLFRIAVDATWRFFEGHGLTLGLSSHLTTATLPIGTTNMGMGMGMGGGNTGALGPLWVRAELGYSLAL